MVKSKLYDDNAATSTIIIVSAWGFIQKSCIEVQRSAMTTTAQGTRRWALGRLTHQSRCSGSKSDDRRTTFNVDFGSLRSRSVQAALVTNETPRNWCALGLKKLVEMANGIRRRAIGQLWETTIARYAIPSGVTISFERSRRSSHSQLGIVSGVHIIQASQLIIRRWHKSSLSSSCIIFALIASQPACRI